MRPQGTFIVVLAVVVAVFLIFWFVHIL